jgi:TM2 domain-containing membrane protein YozV
MSGPVCPYCRTPIESEAEAWVCAACSTPHHRECWEENAGCTVFGCAEAPVEEAKVVVSGADFGPGGYAGAHPLPTTGVAPPPPPVGGAVETAVPGTSVAHGMLGLSELPATPISLSGIDVAPTTDRRTYILLAILFGYLGVHNLYANRMSVGIMQLCVTVLTCFLAAPLTWIWALTEVFGVREDGDGNRML